MADVLKYTARARLKLTCNDAILYDQVYYDDDVPYVESTGQRIVLATNMGNPQRVDLSGVTSVPGSSSGVTLFVETNRDIQIAINVASRLWPLSANGALMLVGCVTRLYIFNESTTNLATVEVVCVG